LIGTTEANTPVTISGMSDQTSDASGEFTVDGFALALGANSLTLTAEDIAGNDGLLERTFTRTEEPDCPFNENLNGWVAGQSGGSPDGHGTVGSLDCAAVLSEGDSFVTTLETSFVVPAGATQLSFSFDALNFDTTDPSFINDAFEAALLDEEGNSLVATYTTGRDAFFNVTEGLSPSLGSDATQDGNTVTLDVSGILVGTAATLVLRLANNDSDNLTTVQITDFSIPGFGTEPVSTAGTKFYVADAGIESVFGYTGVLSFAAKPSTAWHYQHSGWRSCLDDRQCVRPSHRLFGSGCPAWFLVGRGA